MTTSVISPIFVGSLSLDIVRGGPAGMDFRWGGVMNNMACAAGTFGVGPVLVTANYDGELRSSVAHHLSGNGVSWLPLAAAFPLPLFMAEVDPRGDVLSAEFAGDEALTSLTEELLAPLAGLIRKSPVVISCTDLTAPALAWLRKVTREVGAEFWLLSSAATEIDKFDARMNSPDCVGINLDEFTLRAGRELTTAAAILHAAAEIVGEGGHCVITLGKRGALMVDLATEQIYHQPASIIEVATSTVGAGDALFGCVLAGHLRGLDWADALKQATRGVAGYLMRSGSLRNRPYLGLLDTSIDVARGRWCSDDADLRLLTAPGRVGDS